LTRASRARPNPPRDKEGQGWKASTTPLRISPGRIDWLRGQGRIDVTRTIN
jgi:hypothetical protein